MSLIRDYGTDIDRPAPDEILKLYSGGMNDGRIKKADTPVSGEA